MARKNAVKTVKEAYKAMPLWGVDNNDTRSMVVKVNMKTHQSLKMLSSQYNLTIPQMAANLLSVAAPQEWQLVVNERFAKQVFDSPGSRNIGATK